MSSLSDRGRALLATHGPRLLAMSQRLFFLVAVVAICAYVAFHLSELGALLSWRVAIRCVGAAIMMAALHPLIATAFFHLQLFSGIEIGLWASLAIYMRRIPARYLPGGIWHSTSRLADMRVLAGVSGAKLRRQFVYEMVLVGTSGLVTCGVWIAAMPNARTELIAAIELLVGVVIALGVLMVLFRHPNLRHIVQAAILFVAIWSLISLAFALVALSVDKAESSCGVAALAGTYLISAVQGYFAIFAPQGWGVTEASFAVLNPCRMELSEVLGIFLLFRCSAMVGDLLGFGAWAIVAGRAGQRSMHSV
jgi:hypothetical protein